MDIPSTVVHASTRQHTHTVVFLHGRGDNAQSFVASLAYSRDSQGRNLGDAFPSFRWVFPQAPTRQCASSLDRWPQWFDIWNIKDFGDREILQANGLREVVPEINKILRTEAEALGSRESPAWERVIIAGISMGAATSVHVLFNLDAPRLGGFIGFSCRCPFQGRDLQQMRAVLALDSAPTHDHVLRNTPMLLETCVDDPLVKVENFRLMRDTLKGFGANVSSKEYPTGGHWFHSPTGIDDAIAFLGQILAGK